MAFDIDILCLYSFEEEKYIDILQVFHLVVALSVLIKWKKNREKEEES